VRFWIIGRRKRNLEVLSSGVGIFQNSLTIQFDQEAQQQIASRDSRRKIVPGEIIDQEAEDI
jgi:hypothetical protein